MVGVGRHSSGAPICRVSVAIFGRHSNTTTIRPADADSLCQPGQSCITSALTEASDEEGPCPKCKRTVGLHDLTAIGKGGGSSSSSAGAGGPGGSGFEAELEPQEDREDAHSDYDDSGGEGFGGEGSGEKYALYKHKYVSMRFEYCSLAKSGGIIQKGSKSPAGESLDTSGAPILVLPHRTLYVCRYRNFVGIVCMCFLYISPFRSKNAY